MTNSILLTGSSGFLGSRILQKSVFTKQITPVSLQSTPIPQINLSGISTIVHCAGIAHRMEQTDDSLYFEVNRDLTVELATAAKANGVKQFVFLSTIKVFGLDSSKNLVEGHGDPLSFELSAFSSDSYGQSKLAAEIALKELEDETFCVSIIRPPLIYGPGAKGNLQKLMQAIGGNTPLPLGGIRNRRSMVYMDNLIALIDLIIEKQLTITITPADQPALSTTELVRHLASTINPTKRILKIPVFLRPIIKILKPAFYHRLFGSLEVAAHPELYKLGYQQPFSVEEGLKEMAVDFVGVKSEK